MAYNLITPCEKCPFRTDIKPYLRPDRVEEILHTQGEFPCHKTITLGDQMSDDDDNWCEIVDDRNAQVCAGFLICLEHEEQPNQMMRIAERLGLYDPRKLRMNSPVYKGIDAAIEAHEKPRKKPMAKKFKVWITKYALTQGILERTVEYALEDNTSMVVSGWGHTEYWHKPYWHLSKLMATKHAEQMRLDKIKSLEKQLAKMRMKEFPYA